jgi:hypothetical protein
VKQYRFLSAMHCNAGVEASTTFAKVGTTLCLTAAGKTSDVRVPFDTPFVFATDALKLKTALESAINQIDGLCKRTCEESGFAVDREHHAPNCLYYLADELRSVLEEEATRTRKQREIEIHNAAVRACIELINSGHERSFLAEELAALLKPVPGGESK